MKLNKYLFITALAGMTLAGCADLDTAPKGNTITADQKAEVVAENPEMVSASVTGITSMFSIYENTSGNHNDFGYPSVMLFTDSRGIDLVGMDVGYNWFSYGLDLNDGLLATIFTLDGVPMVYNGQEIADTAPHSIWSNRDHGKWGIDWSAAATPEGEHRLELVKALARLRHEHPSFFDAPTE